MLKEVEQWTDREYASVLARGDRLTEVERHDAAAKLARYTSLSPSDIDANNLRIGMSYFCKELLKQSRRSIGRFDSRYQGIESSAASASPSFDPSLAAVRAPTRQLLTTTSASSWATRLMFPILSWAKESAAGTGSAIWAIRPRPTTCATR